MRKLLSIVSCLLAFCFWLWSFTLTDVQLLYSQHPLWVSFQQSMTELGKNANLVVGLYSSFLLISVGLYVLMLRYLRNEKPKRISKPTALVLGACVLLLAFSNPALSYDLFNYMFDAKLVMHYHLDPHVTSAISFSETDDWVRFMRNVFFPTTYGYVWTALSVLPYIAGFGKFILTFLFFKLYMALSLLLLVGIQWLIHRKYFKTSVHATIYSLSGFCLLPLVLIETLSSAHNDLWMMVLAFASLSLLFPGNSLVGGKHPTTKKGYLLLLGRLLVSFTLLYASAQVKRSTTLLLPIWSGLSVGLFLHIIPSPAVLKKWYLLLGAYWADVSAVLLFIPLLTELSRQFHPWYLLWSLSFLPFLKLTWLRVLLIVFSFTSLLRYVPYLMVRVYSDELMMQSKMITWSAIPLFFLLMIVYGLYQRSKGIR